MTVETKQQLRQLLGRCDPSRPLPATDEKLYVPRTNTFREIVREHLLSNSQARVLVSGQSGVGKSTELVKLAQELSDKFYVLTPPIDLYLDLEVMNWQDIMVFSALHLASELIGYDREAAELFPKLIEEKIEKLKKIRYAEPVFFLSSVEELCRLAKGYDDSKEPYTEDEEGMTQEEAMWSILAEIDIDEIKHLFQTSFSTVHENLLRNSRRAIELSTKIFQAPAPAIIPDVITILDGTEKLNLDQVVQLFYRQGRVATQFPSRLVVVVPLEVCYEDSYEQIKELFTTHQFLRAIACQGNDAVACKGREFFKNMVVQRLGDLPENLVDWAAINKAIDHSAGIPRQFLMILQHAVQVAILEGFSTVNDYCVSRGIEKARERFYYQLGKKDKRDLAEFARTKEWGNELRHLHRLTCIVEVENGGIQRILNPLCEPFLEG